MFEPGVISVKESDWEPMSVFFRRGWPLHQGHLLSCPVLLLLRKSSLLEMVTCSDLLVIEPILYRHSSN